MIVLIVSLAKFEIAQPTQPTVEWFLLSLESKPFRLF
jgi:hypothetical protein